MGQSLCPMDTKLLGVSLLQQPQFLNGKKTPDETVTMLSLFLLTDEGFVVV